MEGGLNNWELDHLQNMRRPNRSLKKIELNSLEKIIWQIDLLTEALTEEQ